MVDLFPGSKWICPSCTVINSEEESICEVCASPCPSLKQHATAAHAQGSAPGALAGPTQDSTPEDFVWERLMQQQQQQQPQAAPASRRRDRSRKNPEMDFVGRVIAAANKDEPGQIETIEGRMILFQDSVVILEEAGPLKEIPAFGIGSRCVVVAVEDPSGGLRAVRVTPCYEMRGEVTHLYPEKSFGIIANHIYFHLDRVRSGMRLVLGQSVFVRAVKQGRGKNSWKATSVTPVDDNPETSSPQQLQLPTMMPMQFLQHQHQQHSSQSIPRSSDLVVSGKFESAMSSLCISPPRTSASMDGSGAHNSHHSHRQQHPTQFRLEELCSLCRTAPQSIALRYCPCNHIFCGNCMGMTQVLQCCPYCGQEAQKFMLLTAEQALQR